MTKDRSQLVQGQHSNNIIDVDPVKEARRETDMLYTEKRIADVAILDAQKKVEQATSFLAQVEADKTAADKAVLDGAEELAGILLEEDTIWNNRYKELLKYKETHGNCNVKCTMILSPENFFNTKNSKLEYWMQQVRLGALKPLGDPEHLEPYKINALNSLDFDWQTDESIWLQEYLNLKRYMDRYGRGKIPNMRTNTLGVWCAEQIIANNKFQKEIDSSMNMNKIILMNHIGFVWDTRPAIWMQRYTTLYEYCERNGHCRVPASHKNQMLFRWVVRERKKYRNFLAKKLPTQTDEQRTLLDNLNFANSLIPHHRNVTKQNANNDDASDMNHDTTEESSSVEEVLE